ncbi:MAG: hypothetical protein Q7R92_03075 [bacterium]|nr:hypothetical protein [bacterium]
MGSYLTNINEIGENQYIDLKGKAGLIKIQKNEDTKEVIIYTDEQFGSVGQSHCDVMALLSLFFNKGIELTRVLTFGNGSDYYPQELNKYSIKISKEGYDDKLFEKYFIRINNLCSSSNTNKNRKGKNLANLLSIYKNALLLYPKFSEESYLDLIKILDAQRHKKDSGVWSFPEKVIPILSKKFVRSFYKEIRKIEYFRTCHIDIANKFFSKNYIKIKNAVKNISVYSAEEYKFMYAVLFSLYEYRSKNIHDGFMFPSKIKGIYKGNGNEPLNYLDGSFGEGYMIESEPFKSVDIHKCLNMRYENIKGRNRKNFRDYKKLYLLLPKWNFLNLITREVIFYHLKRLK